jgi:ubiquinone/menaquinone biosynthesis C-methylase UbiE
LLKRGVQSVMGVWIFDAGAKIYNAVNTNETWKASSARLIEGMGGEEDGLLVLDLGIGPGVSAISMGDNHPSARFIGLDISKRMLESAKENREKNGWPADRLALLRGDALLLPLVDGAVDAAAGHSFLYLLPDHCAALHEAYRVVRPGGSVAFLEPYAGKVDWRWLWQQRSVRLLISLTLWRFYNWLHGRFSKESMRRTLEQAGFNQIDLEVTLGGFGIIGRGRKPRY